MSATFQCCTCGEVVGSYHRATCVRRGQVLPSEAPGCIEAAVAVVKNRDYARGVAEGERRATARVVAWLRCESRAAPVKGREFNSMCRLADAIERGEHEEGT